MTLSVADALVAHGASTTISWSAAGAETCVASGSWGGNKATHGSEEYGPLLEDAVLMLECTGQGGVGVAMAEVQIAKAVSVSLGADPDRVALGGSSIVEWRAEHASACTASGAWIGAKPVAGSVEVGPLDADATYTLTCEGPEGSAVGMVTVQALSRTLRWERPTHNEDGSPAKDLAGYVVYWGTESATYTDSHRIEDPQTTAWEMSMAPGDYYLAVTAFDTDGNESDYSNEAYRAIP